SAVEDRREKVRVRESCVLALGLLTDPRSPHYAGVVRLLERTLQEREEQTPAFAAIALGFAGGDDAVKVLRRHLVKESGGRTAVRPWVGLSLGVLAWRDRASKREDRIKDLEGVVEDLSRAMKEERVPGSVAAYALALGLAGDAGRREEMTRKMLEIGDED